MIGNQVTTSSLLGVKDTSLLQDLGKDRDGRVDGVGNDQDESLGAGVGDGLSEGCTDTSVDLQSAPFDVIRRNQLTFYNNQL